MILIPEQISYLRNQIKITKENIRSYNDYLSSKDITSGDYSSRAFIGDSVLDDQYSLERKKYRDIMYALENADYKRERSLDVIDIGTKFTVEFDGDYEHDEILLVEGVDGLTISGGDGFVSLNSLLGQNVIGKKEGEHFEYTVITGRMPTDKRKVSGTIKSIVKDPKAYASFIREKRKSDRISKIYKARRHELLSNPTKENLEELESYNTISLSQRLLLLIEAERLSKYGKDRNAVNRMTVVKRLLSESHIAKPLDDGTIGVGTKFELRYNKDGQIETITGEMINQAVTDEVDTDYVERVSPLGQQIYGLRVGDPFTFRDGNKVYKGSVASVEIAQQPQETLGYQYHK